MAVYEGGVPTSAGSNLFPKSTSEGEESQLFGGEGKVKMSNGGPAEMGPNKNPKDFLTESGYDTGNMEAGRPGSMKVVNPDDLS